MLFSSTLWLLAACSSLLLQLGASIPLAQFYPYGTAVGDGVLSEEDDGSSSRINLTSNFPFFASNHSNLYVNNNGLISFNQSVRLFTSTPFPLSTRIDLIAPYWADVDTRGGRGRVFYREASREAEVRMRAQSEIRMAFVDQARFVPSLVFVATWERVGYFGGRSSSLRNTFQCILVSNGSVSFVLFYYADGEIQWTTGSSSGGTNGLGGTEAQVGFNAADGRRFATVPGSQTPEIINIDTTSNVGRPGVWIFRVDTSEITITECEDSASLQISPQQGNMLGGTLVVITGPCFLPSDDITCMFEGSMVQGFFISAVLAGCVTPYLERRGWGDLTVTVWSSEGDGDSLMTRYSEQTRFYATSIEDSSDVRLWEVADGYILPVPLHLLPETPITVRWDHNSLLAMASPNSYRVNISLSELDLQSGRWTEVAVLVSNTTNDGIHYDVLVPLIPSQSTQTEVRPMVLEVSVASAPSIGVVALENAVGTVRLWSSIVYYSSTADLLEPCERWRQEQREGIGAELLDRLPPCPRTVQQARAPNSGFREDTGPARFSSNGFFHRGAETCFRQTTFSESHMRSGQQCCYSNGFLATNAPSGGTVDLVSPEISLREHLIEDVIPSITCCLSPFANCDVYYSNRPSDLGGDYNPPPPACVFGDPHLVTLDGFKYTFNGAGEFDLITAPGGQFSLQGRMEVPTNLLTQDIQATVFTALVAKEAWSDTVQIQLRNDTTLEMLVNGETVDFGLRSEQEFANVTVADLDSSIISARFSARFSSGVYLEVREDNGIISTVLVSLSEAYRGQTAGLLGNFNGDTSDDLTPRQVERAASPPALPLTSSNEIIHGFGLSWIINNASDSLFTYEDEISLFSFYDPTFTPTFSPTFTSPQAASDAALICDGDRFCLFDVAATGSILIGLSTLQANLEFENIANISRPVSCEPPCQNGVCVAMNTCVCSAGYGEDDCSQPILTDCDINPCNNGGTCRMRARSFICSCPEGFSGIHCQTGEAPTPSPLATTPSPPATTPSSPPATTPSPPATTPSSPPATPSPDRPLPPLRCDDPGSGLSESGDGQLESCVCRREVECSIAGMQTPQVVPFSSQLQCVVQSYEDGTEMLPNSDSGSGSGFGISPFSVDPTFDVAFISPGSFAFLRSVGVFSRNEGFSNCSLEGAGDEERLLDYLNIEQITFLYRKLEVIFEEGVVAEGPFESITIAVNTLDSIFRCEQVDFSFGGRLSEDNACSLQYLLGRLSASPSATSYSCLNTPQGFVDSSTIITFRVPCD